MTLTDALNGLDDKLGHAPESESGPREVLSYFDQNVKPLLPLPCSDEPNPDPIDEALVKFSEQPGILGPSGPVEDEIFRRYENVAFGVFRIAGREGMYVYSDRVQMGVIGVQLGDRSMQCKLFFLQADSPVTNIRHPTAMQSLARDLRSQMP
jgi:hypothetical protein